MPRRAWGGSRGAVRGVTSAAKLAAFGIGGIAIAGAGIGIALATQFIGAGKEMQRFSNRDGTFGRAVVGDGVCGGACWS